MSTHWKKLTNPNYIGSYTIEQGKDMVVEIENVSVQKVQTGDGNTEEKVVANLVGQKPMVLNKTNMESITEALGTPYIEEWVGQKITLYVARVSAFGEMVDALRVRTKPTVVNESPISSTATSEQVAKILAELERTKVEKEKIYKTFNVTDLTDLTKAEADKVIAKLVAKVVNS